MSTYIESLVRPIGEFLHNAQRIKVPTYQRNYAWSDEEIKQIWLDICEAIDSGQKDYFLGPMVLKKEEDAFEIIDGQQRIATIFIILSVIKRILRENGDDQRADWFNNEYFGKTDVDTLYMIPKFSMNEINNPYFTKHIVAHSSRDTINEEIKKLLKKDSNYLVLQAIQIIWEYAKDRQKQESGNNYNLSTLLTIEKYIKNKLNVLLLIVTDEADAYVIFETLNDRGIGLTTMDLLKNHVFGKAGSHLEQIKKYWIGICDNLADTDPNERFLYHYWTSYSGRTSKNKLFRLMRDHITDPTSALGFIKNVFDGSKVYSALNNSGDPYWNSYSQTTKDNIDTLNLLDAQQALPILLAASEIFTEEEFEKLTKILVVMAIRYNLIGELRTGVLANYYVEIPAKIRNKTYTKAAKIFRAIKNIYPNDNDFIEAFSIKVIKNAKRARYILSEIEKKIQISKLQVVNDPKIVNLEHILPKNPSNEWKDVISEIGSDEINDFKYRIGNLALTTAQMQKNAGSKNFDYKKKHIYNLEEHIDFTKTLAKYERWSKNEIEERQKDLANIAVKVWSIEIE